MGTKILIYVLVVLFASSSWLSINSVWMELPLLTDLLPEGWSLPSYLTVIIQLACIGPVLYGVLKKCYDIAFPTQITIVVLILFCAMCTALMAFFWSQTIVIFGQPRSLVLMLLLFGMALVNATSNVLFMPYMATYHSSYLTAYFVGMGLSALFPSIVSIAQGSGSECVIYNGTAHRDTRSPNFGISEYNLIMLAWLLMACMAFILLCRLSSKANQRSNGDATSGVTALPVDESSPLSVSESSGSLRYADVRATERELRSKKLRFVLLLLLMGIVNAQMNGIVPSIQSYATLPYSQATYHLGLTLSNIISPFICLLPLVITVNNTCVLVLMTALTSVLTAVIVAFAAMSPTPILQHSVWGSVLIVTISVTSSALQSFLRTVLATALSEDKMNSESHLFWGGAFIQGGSFIGSCVMFPLVNIYNVFLPAPPCQ